MRAIVFDTGPIISLTLNNILWLLESLHERFNGEFYITPAVYDELIKKPLSTRKYKFEALQILPLIAKGIIKIDNSAEIEPKANELLELANQCFMAHGNYIKIVHKGEMQTIACALLRGSDTIVVDERTTRILIENINLLERYLNKKLHTAVKIDKEKSKRLKDELKGLKVIRSFELVTVAFEMGLLNLFILKEEKNIVPDLRKAVLEGVLWGIKLSGCSVKTDDIYRTISIEERG